MDIALCSMQHAVHDNAQRSLPTVAVCRYAVHYDDQDMDDWRPPPDPYSEFGSDLGWGDESFFEAPHEREKGYLRLDSHILSTPAMGDIDGDGHLEVVVAASYYFDLDYYAEEVTPQPAAETGIVFQGVLGR